MKKLLFGSLVLFLFNSSFAQIDSSGLKKAMQQLDKALLQKDETILNSVLQRISAMVIQTDGYKARVIY